MSQPVRSMTDNVQVSHLPRQQNESQSTVCDEAVEKTKEDLPATAETANIEPTESGKPKRKPSFYLAVLSLMLVILIVSLDATALSVAIPVSKPRQSNKMNSLLNFAPI
ncbi:hypothetical protein EIK77_000733 [Talaromyces pinophilus]|jgi:hypothetical protein|nr:hypothetical protein EIK77_000733 [Talaromyces pinophilus]